MINIDLTALEKTCYGEWLVKVKDIETQPSRDALEEYFKLFRFT